MVFAIFSAALHCYAHKVIGAPRIDKDGMASVTRGMVGSFYGVWLARSYNAAIRAHAAKIRDEVVRDAVSDPNALIDEARRYGEELDENPPAHMGEYLIAYVIRCRAHTTQPLLWQKSAGLCSACTAFWLHSVVFWLLMAAQAFPPSGIGIVLMGWALFPPTAFFVQQSIINSAYNY